MASSTQDITSGLNAVLAHVLCAINQYFLHARMLKHMGHMALADHKYKESIDAMKNADRLVEHILARGGVPDMQDLSLLTIGKGVDGILASDLALNTLSKHELQKTIALCQAQGDSASALLLEKILASVEERISFYSAQVDSISSVGLNAYLKAQA